MRITSITSGFISDPPMTVMMPAVLIIGVNAKLGVDVARRAKPALDGYDGIAIDGGPTDRAFDDLSFSPDRRPACSSPETNRPPLKAASVERNERRLHPNFKLMSSSFSVFRFKVFRKVTWFFSAVLDSTEAQGTAFVEDNRRSSLIQEVYPVVSVGRITTEVR